MVFSLALKSLLTSSFSPSRAIFTSAVCNKIPQDVLFPFNEHHPSQRERHETLQASDLPKLPISLTGSVYNTQRRRLTPLKDPNAPKDIYGCSESLKWVDWRMLKDVRRRHIFTIYHPLRENIRLVYKSFILPTELSNTAHRQLAHALPLYSSHHQVRMRCAVTSRGRGKLFKFRLSRFIFRHLADYNKLSGVIRSCWGP